MKTKAQRDTTSKKRQKVCEEMVVWAQKVKDLRTHPERRVELDFAKTQLKRCRDALQVLNMGEHKQRVWANAGRVLGNVFGSGDLGCTQK
jgi:hypothetical protein